MQATVRRGKGNVPLQDGKTKGTTGVNEPAWPSPFIGEGHAEMTKPKQQRHPCPLSIIIRVKDNSAVR